MEWLFLQISALTCTNMSKQIIMLDKCKFKNYDIASARLIEYMQVSCNNH